MARRERDDGRRERVLVVDIDHILDLLRTITGRRASGDSRKPPMDLA